MVSISVEIQAAVFHFLLLDGNPTPLIHNEIKIGMVIYQVKLSIPVAKTSTKTKRVFKTNGNNERIVNPLYR